MKNKKTLYHFVLDNSGSMDDCKESTVKGFNSQLKTIKKLQKELPKQEFEVSLTLFNDHIDHIYSNVNVPNFKPLRLSNYWPNGSTSLLDAIGTSINKIRAAYESKIQINELNVVMIILTDGMENSSKEFTFSQIADSITSLEKEHNWIFTFLGADINAFEISKMLNIRNENVIAFNKENMDGMMNNISKGIIQYSLASNAITEDISINNFFDFIENKDQRD
jgi:hypothetical protein